MHPGAEPALGTPVDPLVEDQRDLVGAAEVEVLTDDVFKEHASGERPVKHLGEGELGLQDRDVIAIPRSTVADP